MVKPATGGDSVADFLEGRMGYALRYTRYREIYHRLDDADPGSPVTEIQVEIV